MEIRSPTPHSSLTPACAHAHHHADRQDAMYRNIVESCAKRNLRLTPMRQEVMLTLLAHHQPMGAYDLLAKVSHKHNKQLAPVTIYRALDFLVEHGFAHKLETQNAYVACTSETHHTHEHKTHEGVVFLMCTTCGGVDEIQAPHVHDSVHQLMLTTGFAPRSQVLEFSGVCEHCKPT
jgi:Fur family transcriptional regulator, zinc uptake regulator